MPLDDRGIAISATFTAEAIQPGLAFWTAELGLDYEIRFAGYAQLFQELLDPSGLFARNRGGFNVALVRLEDIPAPGSARDLLEAVRSAAGRLASPLILAVCPPTPRERRLVRSAPAHSLRRHARPGIGPLHLAG